MHGADGEIGLPHFLRQPVDLALRVAENNCLCDREGVVQVTECVKFPFFALHSNEELFYPFQSQFITEKKQTLVKIM